MNVQELPKRKDGHGGNSGNNVKELKKFEGGYNSGVGELKDTDN
jgi:hypothetical protein